MIAAMNEEDKAREARYRAREDRRDALELLAGAALARYVCSGNAGRAISERLVSWLLRRAAEKLGCP